MSFLISILTLLRGPTKSDSSYEDGRFGLLPSTRRQINLDSDALYEDGRFSLLRSREVTQVASIDIQTMNADLVESAANTYTDGKFEIPGSSGAKKVFLRDGQISCTAPGVENSVNTVFGSISAGDRLAMTSMPTLGSAGMMANSENISNGDATDYLAFQTQSPVRCTVPWEIPKAPDGKFYVTLHVLGVNNTLAKHIAFAGSFLIER